MASAWISPSTRPENIDYLVSGVDRYNPSNVTILEDYLLPTDQKPGVRLLGKLRPSSSCRALYQFNPDLYNPDVIINILMKSLTASPLPDFNLCMSLLEDKPINATLDEPDPLPALLPIIQGLHELLDRCRFPKFWEVYHSNELENLRDNYTVEYVGFEDAVREVAEQSDWASILDLEGPELQAYVENLGWSVDQSGTVVNIPPNPDNQIEATVVQENIKLPQLIKVISHAAKA
ncbi:initiation factor 3 [Desarmillaria tabescens]|uniref:Eukaryotic translation initiation factor 3 subunit K n=1 Tax=Armillaria tabescens TaxID=1929756 RepID=A0AA39NGV4_ARMTA|nr:initiation factor 3 [Desarmillaria tabescens]KAK0465400.1 initiation factor 3 [Desarmillaria tabescens]